MTATPSAPAVTTRAGARPVAARPPLRHRLTVPAGNLLQTGGMLTGSALIAAAGMTAVPAAARLALTLTGWLLVYLCSHAIGHYLAGRAVGIRFRGYGIRGTDHPEHYPPLLRQLMSAAPFFTALTDRPSLVAAAPWRKAVMFATGETATAVCSIAAAAAATALDVPGSGALLTFSIVWNVASTIATAVTSKGDYAKAIHALRSR